MTRMTMKIGPALQAAFGIYPYWIKAQHIKAALRLCSSLAISSWQLKSDAGDIEIEADVRNLLEQAEGLLRLVSDLQPSVSRIACLVEQGRAATRNVYLRVEFRAQNNDLLLLLLIDYFVGSVTPRLAHWEINPQP